MGKKEGRVFFHGPSSPAGGGDPVIRKKKKLFLPEDGQPLEESEFRRTKGESEEREKLAS